MDETLYRMMLKQDRPKVVALSAGTALYEGLITWVYPILMRAPAIKQLPEIFPPAVKRAFGVSTDTKQADLSYEAYISAQLLGRLWPLITSFYGISAIHALIGQPIARGHMAYLLSVPVTRSELLSTQVGVVLTELALLNGVMFGGIRVSTAIFKIEIAGWAYFRLGILAFALGAAISVFSLLPALFFAGEEQALHCADMLLFLFYGLDIISSLDDRFSALKNLTPFGLFRPQALLQKKTPPRKAFMLLGGGAGLCLWLARILFARKDLAV